MGQPADLLDGLESAERADSFLVEDTSYYPQERDASVPIASPYMPGLILQADEDPSSYIHMSSPQINTEVESCNFEFSSLPQTDKTPERIAPEVRCSPLIAICPSNNKRRFFLYKYLCTFRKSLKQHSTNRYPKTSMHCLHSESQKRIWWQLRDIYQTDIRPESDFVWQQLTYEEVRHHWEKVMRRFLERSAYERYYSLFCELIFADSPAGICTKTQLRCCECSVHSRDCEEKWKGVKEFMQTGLLTELQIPLPSIDRSEYELFSSYTSGISN